METGFRQALLVRVIEADHFAVRHERLASAGSFGAIFQLLSVIPRLITARARALELGVRLL